MKIKYLKAIRFQSNKLNLKISLKSKSKTKIKMQINLKKYTKESKISTTTLSVDRWYKLVDKLNRLYKLKKNLLH